MAKELSKEQIRQIQQLHKDGVGLLAIQRALLHNMKVIRKYAGLTENEGSEEKLCACSPGMYFIGCQHCDIWKGYRGEEKE